jgi:hypothetical protein
MEKTLLKMVQNTLSLMDSDEINSIGDTIEGEQIAVCYSTIYDQIVTEYSLPGKNKTIRIGATDDNSLGKTRLFLNQDMMSIDNIQYDVRDAVSDPPNYTTITVISNQEFLDRQINKDTSDSNILSQTWPNTDITFGVYTNKAPRYATLVEDRILVFDSIDIANDSTQLQASKSRVSGEVQDALSINDTTEVTLPGELLNLLETNATELAFDLYKQVTPTKITHLARKARVRQQRNKFKFRDQRRTGEDYGRKSPGTSRTRPTGVDSGSATPLPDYI